MSEARKDKGETPTMSDPFAGIEWPKPSLALRDETGRKLILKAVTIAERKPPKSRSARLAFLRRLLGEAADVLIREAAKIAGATCPERKALVRRQLMDTLRSLEARLGLIPDFLEPAAFKVLEAALDGIIEAVYGQLRARGVV